MLRRQAELNGCAAQITIVRAAVADHPGPVELVSTGPRSAGYMTTGADHPGGDRTSVSGTTVDELSRCHGPPTHIKIDVEGSETAVLSGAAMTLRSAHPLVFLELHPTMLRRAGIDVYAPVTLLDEAGYDTFRSVNGQHLDRAALDIYKDVIRMVVGRSQR